MFEKGIFEFGKLNRSFGEAKYHKRKVIDISEMEHLAYNGVLTSDVGRSPTAAPH